MSQAEIVNAHSLGPKTGQTAGFPITAATNLDYDLSTLTTVAPIIASRCQKGGALFLIMTADSQVAFGDAAVTISTNDPVLKSGILYRFTCTGSHLAFKGVGTGVGYIWPASDLAP